MFRLSLIKSTISLDRRIFLEKFLLFSGFWAIWGKSKFVFAKSEILQESTVTLGDFLDVLIPEDVSPSASQVNLHHDLIKHSNTIENYLKLIMLGCQWLDLQSQAIFGKKFTKLASDQRNRVVEIASQSQVDSIASKFFSRVRRDAFTFYYGKPESWRGINFPGPPQPFGYPDYVKRPDQP